MTEFWIAAGLITLVVGALLVLGLVRGRAPGDDTAADLRVYRDQLREVDKDLARGVIGADDADRLRTEISRRILDVDRARAAGARPDAGLSPRAGRVAGFGLVALTLAGSIAIYLDWGAPGYPDMPLAQRLEMAAEARATRPAQAAAEAEIRARETMDGGRHPPDATPDELALVERLRQILAEERPDDLEGHRLLVMSEGRLGNFDAAHRAQARVIELLGDDAEPEEYLLKADLMINAAWGYVSPEAEQALELVLRRDPTNPMARYFYGMMFGQNDRADLAFQLWRQVLQDSAPDDPWVAPIRGQIEQMAMRAGVQFSLPPEGAPRGPTEADIAAAMELEPEARAEMIEGMVAQLSNRLATEGGSAADWGRLIAAYGVMGAFEDARAIWTEAQMVFADRPDALAVVREAAEAAGVVAPAPAPGAAE